MTREKAIDIIKCLAWHTRPNEEDVEQAIKALEQKPKSEWQKDHEILKAYSDGANEVLDKISAEIEKYIIPKNSVQYDYESKWQNSGLKLTLEIIDKYKAENRENE